MPSEGSAADQPSAGDAARADVPTCSLAELVGELRGRTRDSGWSHCVVINDHRIVLGLLGTKALDGDSQSTAERAMQPAPSTVRPDLSIEETAETMRERDLEILLVTTSDGRLVGSIERKEIELRVSNLRGATATRS